MDPNSGKLYPSVEEARAAGVENPVHIEGRREDVKHVSEAVAALDRAASRDDTHECPHKACTRRVRRNLLACGIHWRLVSPPTQREVYAAYRSGDLVRHSDAMDAAIAEMNR